VAVVGLCLRAVCFVTQDASLLPSLRPCRKPLWTQVRVSQKDILLVWFSNKGLSHFPLPLCATGLQTEKEINIVILFKFIETGEV
jgi:hypothetical protein